MTINAASRSFTVSTSGDGKLHTQYPAGDAPVGPPPADEPDYIQDFSTLTTASDGWDLDALPDVVIEYHPTWNPPGFDPDVYPYQRTFVSSPKREGTLSLRIENHNADVDGQGRHRIETRFGKATEKFDNQLQGVDYWFGFSIRIDSTQWPATGASTEIIVAQMTINSASPWAGMRVSMATGNLCKAVYEYASSTGSSKEMIRVNFDPSGLGGKQMKMDTWYDVVIHSRWDTPGVNGRLEVWMDEAGAAVPYKWVDFTGTYGTADEASVSPKYCKNGLYYGSPDYPGTEWAAFYSTFRAFVGVDGYDHVKPRGTPS